MNIARRLVHTVGQGSTGNRILQYKLHQSQQHFAMSTQDVPPVESSIRQKLTDQFNPTHIEIINESYMHNVPKGSETHFKVLVVSENFENQPLIKRHRMVNATLEQELSSGVHALSIMAKTPKQWEASEKEVEPSPKCQGGFGS